jgi:hypothetical protein
MGLGAIAVAMQHSSAVPTRMAARTFENSGLAGQIRAAMSAV